MSNVRSLVFALKSNAAVSVHVGITGLEVSVAMACTSAPGESQSHEGAPRRRAAPGNQFVKVAAETATLVRQRGARMGLAKSCPVKARKVRRGTGRHRVCARSREAQEGSGLPRPCAEAQRLRPSHATAGVGASARARHASATHWHASRRHAFSASEHNRCSRRECGAVFQQEPNPSIERTSQRPLRALCAAAHVER
jgi:hypothetical protein